SGGSGIEAALGAVSNIAARVERIPIEEIAGHLKSTAQRLDTLVHDPVLDESLQRLNRSLGEIEKVAVTTRENVGPIADSLRNAAASAEAAAKRAQELIGTQQKQNYDVSELIREVTRAAEAVRALATYLSENPDALL